MRSSTRTGTLLVAAALCLTGAAGCGGGDGGGGGGNDANAKSIKVWTIEDVNERVAAQKKMAQAFTAKSGIKVEIVAVAEDQFDQTIPSAAAGNDLPDVVAALPLSQVRSLASNDLLNSEIAGQVVDELGKDTFAPRALDLTKDGDRQLAVPSDGWAQLLFYRTDLFEKAGLTAPDTYDKIRAAAAKLNTGGTAGVTLATVPNDAFTAQSFENFALGNGCELVAADKTITLDSPQCVQSFQLYGDLATKWSVPGAQDVDSTRATYFAGKAAMVVWSSFLLDELAGLRNDALPTCSQCKTDKTFLAKNTGVVTAIAGPGGKPAQFGEITSWAITNGGERTDAAKRFVTYMMNEGYTDWLGIAPEGKFPVRKGDASAPDKFTKAWNELPAGVDTKQPLGKVFPPEVIEALQNSPDSFQRWGFPQKQGALVGATLGELPVPKAINALAGGDGDAAAAAKQAAEDVRTIQKSLE